MPFAQTRRHTTRGVSSGCYATGSSGQEGMSSPWFGATLVRKTAMGFLQNMHLRPVRRCPSETCSARPLQDRMRLTARQPRTANWDLGPPQEGARYRLAPLSLVARFRCRESPAGSHPNSQNVGLIVGTSGLQSGEVVVDSTMTLAAGERTRFQRKLRSKSAGNVSATFSSRGCIQNCAFPGKSTTTSETGLAFQQTPTRYRR
jgi:hypothetical protein